MSFSLLFFWFLAPGSVPIDGGGDVHSLIATLEELQVAIGDFRCEYEGTLRFRGPAAASAKVAEDTVVDGFSGYFIWKRGGDTRSESLHRSGFDATLSRVDLLVKTSERKAERHQKRNDASVGSSEIRTPDELNSYEPGCLGRIFMIDKIKRDVADQRLVVTLADETIDSRSIKILNIAVKDDPDNPMTRYWIDLGRCGHVVRVESYSEKGLLGRIDIELKAFQVDGMQVWMPIRGDGVSYGAVVDKRPVLTKNPTVLETIYIVGGTLEFNKRPGADVFAIKYKPGTPVSDGLRKLTAEFGQHKISSKPTKLAAQTMLNEQVAQAEVQRKELVVADATSNGAWTNWLIGGFGVLTLGSVGAWWIQKRSY